MQLKWLLIVQMLAQATGTLGLLNFSHPLGWSMLVTGHGLANGIFMTLAAVTWPRFFGREHLGAISGLNMSIMVFASAIGPVLFAKAHQLTGSYDAVIIGCALMPLIVVPAALKANNPQG